MGGEERERSSNLDVPVGERLCQCALEAVEIVPEVGEESLAVVTVERHSREPTMLDSAPENRAPEDDAAILQKRPHIAEDGRLRLR